MKIEPLKHKSRGPPREVSVDHSCPDVDGYLVFPVDRMEVRRRMLSGKDTYHDPQEPRYLRHVIMVPIRLLDINGCLLG